MLEVELKDLLGFGEEVDDADGDEEASGEGGGEGE